MPDVTGKNYYEVKEIFEKNNIILNAVGIESNVDYVRAESQGVAPGEYVASGTQITVTFVQIEQTNSTVTENAEALETFETTTVNTVSNTVEN